MPDKPTVTTLEAQIPEGLLSKLQALVDAGWFGSLDEAVGDALERFVESHRDELLEEAIREDIAWGLYGRD